MLRYLLTLLVLLYSIGISTADNAIHNSHRGEICTAGYAHIKTKRRFKSHLINLPNDEVARIHRNNFRIPAADDDRQLIAFHHWLNVVCLPAATRTFPICRPYLALTLMGCYLYLVRLVLF